MDTKYLIFFILIVAGVLLLLYFLYKNFKFPKTGMFTLVTGGIKSGKSLFAVALAVKTYKKVHRKWAIRKLFRKVLRKDEEEEPLLYSNIPLGIPYVNLNNDILLRKVRPRFGSVIFIDEASLVADSQLIKDSDINEQLMLFCKLIGHELHAMGGLIVNSQAVCDLHYSWRRVCDKRLYIEHTFKWLPFFCVQTMREERYSEDGSVINAYNEDLGESVKRVLVRKKNCFKQYDPCAFSVWTDNKPVYDDVNYIENKYVSKKVKVFSSFRHFKDKDILETMNYEKKDNK